MPENSGIRLRSGFLPPRYRETRIRLLSYLTLKIRLYYRRLSAGEYISQIPVGRRQNFFLVFVLGPGDIVLVIPGVDLLLS